jgi:hypothetical protein
MTTFVRTRVLESTCSLHTRFNSQTTANGGVGIQMNEIVEFWSLPWHALQRTLANGFGAVAPASPSAGSMSWRCAPTQASGGSWLARARGRMAPLPEAAR